jgi:hypothetical protein
MKFNPNDYDPTKDFNPIASGDYNFKVVSAEEKVSKTSGNDMIEMKLEICPPGRKPVQIKDWIVFTKDSVNKIKAFCDATGLNFASGNIDKDDCLGLCGKAKFVQKVSETDGKKYLNLGYYYPLTGKQEAQQVSPEQFDQSDDLPDFLKTSDANVF